MGVHAFALTGTKGEGQNVVSPADHSCHENRAGSINAYPKIYRKRKKYLLQIIGAVINSRYNCYKLGVLSGPLGQA